MHTGRSGTFTFLFTDIEESSRLWERFPKTMGRALARHDQLVREAVESRGGTVFKTVGDAICAVFRIATDAVSAALTAQRAIAADRWDDAGPIKVRMGLHTGTAERRDHDYFGPSLNRVARIMGAGHGRQTLLCRLTAELVRDALPEGATLRDLGHVRLRGLEEPEQLFQIVTLDLPSDFPPLRSLLAAPSNLPVQLTSFIGRERELVEVKRLVTSARLLTLTGPGGTGKTRLLIRTAEEILPQAPGGVWLVELATLSDPGLVVETIASAIGVREQPDEPLLDSLIDFLRPRDALLLIDNCEHLLHECARFAGTVLSRCPRARILASSRAPLGVPGETLFQVPSLSMPDLRRLRHRHVSDPASQFGSYEAVRLFVERAAAVQPGFALTAGNAEAIAQICWRLDGIPHAIELAAARIKILNADQILDRLNDRFRLLAGGSRTGQARQQTLRAMIDWSYELLSEAERALLRRLSVFGRGRTLDAIETVCAGDPVERWDILDLLGHLIDRSMITMENDALGEPRYYMLESLWDYARDKLGEAGETVAFRTRHLDYYVSLAETIEPSLTGPDQSRWLGHLAAERGNIRLAIEWSARTPAGAESGLRLMGALSRYWEVRSYLAEARDHFRTVLENPGAQTPGATRAKALAGAGRMAWCQDDNTAARTYDLQAIEMYRAIGDERAAASIVGFLGFIERAEGDREAAAARFAQTLEAGRTFRDDRLLALAWSGLGSLASDAGQHEEAIRLKRHSLDLYRRIGDKWIIALIGWSLGRATVEHGDFAEAARLFQEFTAIAEELGNRWSMPYVLEGFADVALGSGDPIRAARLFAAAEVMRERAGLARPPLERATCERSLAKIQAAISQAQFEQATAEGRALSAKDAIAEAKNQSVISRPSVADR